ncbi:GNAT family N-acetyltransferase [Streptomyces sp. NPDC047071]|uniref:GNAT family N-acetyltransferase n=1 Tax=Streptomyces sp. NPDC047071 TaxID=3154808 RepID=UPI00345675C9
MTTGWTLSPEPADSPAALALWRAYYTEMSDRWYQVHEGRDTPPEELEREVVAANDHATLAPPSGLLLLGRYAGEPAGTAGIRLFAGGDAAQGPAAELKRLFVRKEARGTGGGPLLLAAAEVAARALGARAVLLDTRDDLTEAWSLYERNGYERTAPHNDDSYAERWYRKRL